MSIDDWENPNDHDATITRMKDGTTRMAYKAEHTVDLDTEILVAVNVWPGSAPATATVIDTAIDAAVNVEKPGGQNEVQAIVADKGYFSSKLSRSPLISACRPISPRVPRRSSVAGRTRIVPRSGPSTRPASELEQ